VLDLPRVRCVRSTGSHQKTGSGEGLGNGHQRLPLRPQHRRHFPPQCLISPGPAIVARDFALAPKTKAEHHRIVLDLEPTTADKFATAAVGDMSGPSPSPSRPRAQTPAAIVVDAGHGGKDPGSMSKKGLLAKDLGRSAAALALCATNCSRPIATTSP